MLLKYIVSRMLPLEAPGRLWRTKTLVSPLIFHTRLQLQQGPLHSQNPGRLMMSPQPKSLKQVLQQVTNKIHISTASYHQDSICTHALLLLISLIPVSCISPLLPTNGINAICIISFLFIHHPHPVLLSKLSTHLHLFHTCFSKTVSILYCGLWRMWSQAIGKVSDRYAMPTICLAAHTLYTGLRLFLSNPRPPYLGRMKLICVWLLHVCLSASGI